VLWELLAVILSGVVVVANKQRVRTFGWRLKRVEASITNIGIDSARNKRDCMERHELLNTLGQFRSTVK
jgi:hypothetical protein